MSLKYLDPISQDEKIIDNASFFYLVNLSSSELPIEACQFSVRGTLNSYFPRLKKDPCTNQNHYWAIEISQLLQPDLKDTLFEHDILTTQAISFEIAQRISKYDLLTNQSKSFNTQQLGSNFFLTNNYRLDLLTTTGLLTLEQYNVFPLVIREKILRNNAYNLLVNEQISPSILLSLDLHCLNAILDENLLLGIQYHIYSFEDLAELNLIWLNLIKHEACLQALFQRIISIDWLISLTYCKAKFIVETRWFLEALQENILTPHDLLEINYIVMIFLNDLTTPLLLENIRQNKISPQEIIDFFPVNIQLILSQKVLEAILQDQLTFTEVSHMDTETLTTLNASL